MVPDDRTMRSSTPTKSYLMLHWQACFTSNAHHVIYLYYKSASQSEANTKPMALIAPFVVVACKWAKDYILGPEVIGHDCLGFFFCLDQWWMRVRCYVPWFQMLKDCVQRAAMVINSALSWSAPIASMCCRIIIFFRFLFCCIIQLF